MTFYTDLRDNVALTLLTQYGQDATHRSVSGSYTPATGVKTRSNTDTAVKMVELPMSRAKDQFSVDQIAKFDQFVLMSATELAAAAVVPKDGDEIIYGGVTSTIVGLSPVQPDGTAVVFKVGVQRK